MSNKTITMLAVGDLILYHKDPKTLFALAAPVLRSADVVVGHGEITYTSRPIVTYAKSAFAHIPNPVQDPSNIDALTFAGFNVMTLAGNHIWDAGVTGIEDSLDTYKNANIATVGAGMNLDEARKPAIIERNGMRIGFLNYNCVGPEESWANELKPGCAYVKIITSYEMDQPCPGATPTIYSLAEPRTLQTMQEDIRKLRANCDVLVVKLHKGLGFVPAQLAMYEQQLSYAAIDAGADLILGEHAHILKGIEQYKGKTIFHNLGNFISNFQTFPSELMLYIKNYVKELYNVDSDPENQSKHYHPEARFTLIAKCTITDGKIAKVSYLPCTFNEQDQPEVLKNDERGQEVFDYVAKISKVAGLNAKFKWDNDEVVIYSE